MKIKLKLIFLAIVIILDCFHATSVECQNDSKRIIDLISLTNETFLTSFAQGVLLSPYEILQHNRSRTINNISYVDSIYFIKRMDTIPIFIKDNRTIIHKPAERFNSYTYEYHKNGRIKKVLRGRHLKDEYKYDKSGFLIQHGHGGELKRAKRKNRTFEWYNVKNNKLVYVVTYDENNKVKYFKKQGQNNVDYDLEIYDWSDDKVISKKTIVKYNHGSVDTAYLAFEYDSLGLIQSINNKNNEEAAWSKINIVSKIEYDTLNNVKIELSTSDVKVFSITFDHYDNWIELENYGRIKSKKIVYRQKKR